MMKFLYIASFGLIGIFFRYFIGELLANSLPTAAPLGTIAINSAGSFLIGIAYVLGKERALFSPDLYTGLTIGLLGGFTTFSTYSLESFRLIEKGNYIGGFSYLILSPVLGLTAASLGILVVRHS
jgi:CrcB protein